jgi:hypothetical protein
MVHNNPGSNPQAAAAIIRNNASVSSTTASNIPISNSRAAIPSLAIIHAFQ